MAYEIGDPNHIQVHNALIADVQTQAERFNVDVTLPDIAGLGDLGHTDDHNLIVAALEAIAAAPGGGVPWVVATGGTVTTVTDDGKTYRVHTLANGDSLTVTTEGYAEYCVVGAGGSGETTLHAGGGGDVKIGTAFFTVGSYPAVVPAVLGVNVYAGPTTFAGRRAGAGWGSSLSYNAAMMGRSPTGSTRGDANTISAGGAGGDAVGQTPGPGVMFGGIEYGRGGRYGSTAEGVTRRPGWGGNKASGETAGQPGTVIVRYPVEA